MSAQQTTSRQADPSAAHRPLLWVGGSPDDSARAAALADRAFDPHFREAWNSGQIASLLSSGSSWLDLARSGDALVAFALCRQALDEVELLLCAVDPQWRRLGIGRRLIERVAEAARSRGASRLFLEVRASNEPALQLYRAYGFAPDGRRSGYYRTSTGETIDAITLSIAI